MNYLNSLFSIETNILLSIKQDLYDRKNMPRVIYSIHALSLYLYRVSNPQIFI